VNNVSEKSYIIDIQYIKITRRLVFTSYSTQGCVGKKSFALWKMKKCR